MEEKEGYLGRETIDSSRSRRQISPSLQYGASQINSFCSSANETDTGWRYHVTPSNRTPYGRGTSSSIFPSLSISRSVEKKSRARCEAELIRASSRVVQLEEEVAGLQRAAKRARLEEEAQTQTGEKMKTSQELERLHYLDQERRELTEKLAENECLLEERERELSEVKGQLESTGAASEKERKKLTTETEELKSVVHSLSNESSYLTTQLSLARQEVGVVKTTLDAEQTRHCDSLRELRERVRELERREANWERSQGRVKELEHKLKQQKHDIQFATAVQSRLLNYEDVERDLRLLREENEALREHSSNVELMRYQLQTMKERLERNGDLEKRVVQLEEENRLLKRRREEGGGRESLCEGPAGLQSRLVQLEQQEVVLLSRCGDVESRLKLAQRAASQADSATMETRKQLAREQEDNRLKGDKIQRLEKRLLFVVKERDGCVNVLNSYRHDTGVDALLKENLTEVEQQLTRARDRIAVLEEELEEAVS